MLMGCNEYGIDRGNDLPTPINGTEKPPVKMSVLLQHFNLVDSTMCSLSFLRCT